MCMGQATPVLAMHRGGPVMRQAMITTEAGPGKISRQNAMATRARPALQAKLI